VSLNNLHHHIFDPTRVVPGVSSTRLDLILSNLPNLVNNAGVTSPVHENDHCTIYGTINIKTTRKKAFVRKIWEFKKANFDNYRETLSNTDWESCFETEDIDDICDKWTKKFLDISRTSIPNKKVTIRPTDKNWFNNYLRRLGRAKDRQHTIAVESNTILEWNFYKAAKNRYFQECDRIKKEYEEHMYASMATDLKANPKRWWSLVGQTMGSKKTSSFPALVKDGIIYTSDKDKAEAFNHTYLESANLAIDGEEETLDEIVLDHELLDHISVTEQDVGDILKGLNTNKAYGPDDVSPRLIKEAGPSIVPVLTRIFNKSLELAKFPLAWKRANVLPIYKKAESFIASNYRPVSLLSVLAKIFEKIVFKYLFNYFRQHFLISVWQSGFLPGSSTITQLTEIYDQFCRAVAKGKEIRVVFLDISKAFDRVWHTGLIHKLRSSGISGKLLDWLKDYLTDRQQRVIINGETSEWGDLKAGVPQGSVLGPLLFLIFINDITHVIWNCKIRLFADDTCLFIEVDEPNNTADMVNEDLDRLSQWADKWKVSFSPPKTEELLVTTKRNEIIHPPLILNETPIKRVPHHKHLGLTLSNDLTWNNHIESITDKANRKLGLLRPLKYKLNRLSLEQIYKGFIRPVLEYGDIVWHSPSLMLNALERVQLNAARIVIGATARCSTEGLYTETAWESLSSRREFHRLTLLYKVTNNIAPQYLIDLLPNQVNDRTNYNLRNRNQLDIPFARINILSNSFFPAGARLWNDLNNDIKALPSVDAFKRRHKSSLPVSNPLYYFGGRLEAAIHARLRIKNSPLKADLCNHLHVIDSPLCPCGSGAEENAKHYFLECTLFNPQRRELNRQLLPFVINNHEYLLFGVPNCDQLDNIHVFTAVHGFIRETKRFY
jgi:hypothetical protein